MANTWRILALRLAFLAICFLPTACVVAAVVRQCWPGKAELLANELSLQLGVRVRLASVRNPQPGIMLLEQVELADPETGEALARTRLLEVHRHERGLTLVASQPELNGDCLRELATRLHDCWLCTAAAQDPDFELRASELNVRDQAHPQTLTDVHVICRNRADGPQVEATFRVAGLEMKEPAQVHVTRNRQMTPPATRWELNTGATPLPLAPLAEEFPALAMLGENAVFQGSMAMTLAPGGSQGEASGELAHIDLEQFITRQFPHRLTGAALLSLRQARWENGRLSEATGELAAGPGMVGTSLLGSASEALQLTLSARVNTAESRLLPYRKLAVGFSLNNTELALTGRCLERGLEVALTDDAGPLLTVKPGAPRPAVALVRTLVPQSDVLVPATNETISMLFAFPVPAVVPPEAAIARPPRVHVKMR